MVSLHRLKKGDDRWAQMHSQKDRRNRTVSCEIPAKIHSDARAQTRPPCGSFRSPAAAAPAASPHIAPVDQPKLLYYARRLAPDDKVSSLDQQVSPEREARASI